MCNAASDGDRYSGRTEPAQVSGGHGAGVGAFMADLAGRRSVLFPKIQREAGET